MGLQQIINGYVNTLSGAGFTRDELTYVGAFNTQSVMDVTDTMKKMLVATYAGRLGGGDPNAADSLPGIIATDPGQDDPINAMEALGLVSADAVSGAIQLAGQEAGLTTAQIAGITGAVDFQPYKLAQVCSMQPRAVRLSLHLVLLTQQHCNVRYSKCTRFWCGTSGIGRWCRSILCRETLAGTVALPYYLATPTEANPITVN